MIRLAAAWFLLLSITCMAQEPPKYPTQDALEKGALNVPAEFVDGVATEDQVIAWAESLILHLYPYPDSLDVLRFDYDGDGRTEIAVADPMSFGSDGGFYLYFDATDSGYRYLGQVPNLGTRPLHCYSDAQDCYLINSAGTWNETSFHLYKIGPLDIRSVALFSLVHDGDRDSYAHLLEFPETEKMLLDRFESRSQPR